MIEALANMTFAKYISLVGLFVIFGLFIFWIYQFIDLLMSKINKMQKGIWIVIFLATPFISAIVYYLVKKKKK